MSCIELSEQELRALREVLGQQAHVQGVESMRIIAGIDDKLRDAESAAEEVGILTPLAGFARNNS